MHFLRLFLSAILLHSFAVHAQMPSGGRILVPVAPGGPVDFVARIVAGRLAARSGATVVVENKPGANGAVAASALMQSPADGKTLMLTGQGTMTISPHLSKLPFDPLRDLTPIAGVAFADSAFVVGAKVPANSLKEFIQLAKSGAPLTLGSGGQGNITHLYIERLKDVSHTDFVHVPYKGVTPAVNDVIGGHIAGAFSGLVAALPHIRSGALKPLGIIGSQRSALLPEVPTMAEQGYPVLDIGWFALIGPPKMTSESVSALATAIKEVLAEKETADALTKAGLNPWIKDPKELAQLMSEESARWGKLIKEKNITE
jgi:tripartite-type tricarboxylate transporter receptor subunit TctC